MAYFIIQDPDEKFIVETLSKNKGRAILKLEKKLNLNFFRFKKEGWQAIEVNIVKVEK